MWEKRKKAEINMAHQNIENDAEREEIVTAEIRDALKQHEKDILMPGVVPSSAKYLNVSDAEGNQLWRITSLKK